jgi:hypothetical protein
MIKKIWHKIWGWVKPYLTPRMLPIVLSIWVLTNGVWYAIAFIHIDFLPNWLSTFAKAYIAFLWLPFSMEKPFVILPLSVLIYRVIYKEKFVKKGGL